MAWGTGRHGFFFQLPSKKKPRCPDAKIDTQNSRPWHFLASKLRIEFVPSIAETALMSFMTTCCSSCRIKECACSSSIRANTIYHYIPDEFLATLTPIGVNSQINLNLDSLFVSSLNHQQPKDQSAQTCSRLWTPPHDLCHAKQAVAKRKGGLLRWCHAHPTWTYWALLFLGNLLLKRYLATWLQHQLQFD